jgi:hypothetical protein
MLLDLPAQARQSLSECNQPGVFRFVTYRPPARMVTVLFAAFRVPSGGLKVAIREWANPHIGPGGGNG